MCPLVLRPRLHLRQHHHHQERRAVVAVHDEERSHLRKNPGLNQQIMRQTPVVHVEHRVFHAVEWPCWQQPLWREEKKALASYAHWRPAYRRGQSEHVGEDCRDERTACCNDK